MTQEMVIPAWMSMQVDPDPNARLRSTIEQIPSHELWKCLTQSEKAMFQILGIEKSKALRLFVRFGSHSRFIQVLRVSRDKEPCGNLEERPAQIEREGDFFQKISDYLEVRNLEDV